MDTVRAQYAASFGGCFIAICVSFVLYGITTIQAYTYLRRFREDSRYIRWTVIWLWIAETAHSALCMKFIYQYLITGWGNLTMLSEINWSIGVSLIITTAIVAVVHCFFIYRIWILSEHRITVVIIPIILVTVNVGFEAASCSYIFKAPTWDAFHGSSRSVMTVYVTTSLLTAIDVLVTGTLIYYLHTRRTGYHRTDLLIRRMETYVVNSGAITIAASLSVLLTFVLAPDNLLYAGLTQLLCKLYNNALLATLNTRSGNSRDVARPHGVNSYEFSLRENATRRPGSVTRPIELAQDVSTDAAEAASVEKMSFAVKYPALPELAV